MIEFPKYFSNKSININNINYGPINDITFCVLNELIRTDLDNFFIPNIKINNYKCLKELSTSSKYVIVLDKVRLNRYPLRIISKFHNYDCNMLLFGDESNSFIIETNFINTIIDYINNYSLNRLCKLCYPNIKLDSDNLIYKYV